MTRARIGVIYPGDGLLDHEFWELAPEGVTVHLTRTPVPPGEITVEEVRRMAEAPDIEEAAARCYAIPVDSFTYACTSNSFVRGVGGDLEIARRIERARGVPATTTSTAMVRALRALGATRVAVAAPYADDVNVTLVSFLEGHGFRVLGLSGMQLRSGIGLVPLEEVRAFARAAHRPGAEALFVACTNFATVGMLDSLERELGIPVLSANQVSMWDALRLAGVPPVKEGCGTLYRLAAAAPA